MGVKVIIGIALKTAVSFNPCCNGMGVKELQSQILS